jgi:hypothetical protein
MLKRERYFYIKPYDIYKHPTFLIELDRYLKQHIDHLGLSYEDGASVLVLKMENSLSIEEHFRIQALINQFASLNLYNHFDNSSKPKQLFPFLTSLFKRE